VVAKRDRLGRDPLALGMTESAVKRKGARIVSAAGEGTDSDEPSAILMRRMIDAFAEYERLIIGARTKAALGAKRARGERTGAIPYGFRLAPGGKRLEVDQTEQTTLALVQELRAGGASLRAIGAALTARGLRPRGGSSWHPQTINNLCRSPDAVQPG
jgi:DNA invertase Pin-like site-specific DNA recombinase